VNLHRLALLALITAFTASCASSPEPSRRFRTTTTASVPANASHMIASSSAHQKVGNAYVVGGRRYVPRRDDHYDQTGIASWYGPTFHGRPTANGEVFDQNLLTAAHPTLPIPSIIEVTNLENGRSVILRLNDRGPFVDDRMIDLSRAAADQLGYRQRGLARVRVRYLGPAQALGAPPSQGAREGGSANPPANLPAAIPVSAPPPVPAPIPAPQPIAVATENHTRNQPPRAQDLADIRPSLTLQAGAFGDPSNAQRLVQRLSSDGGDAWVEPALSGNATIYRVFFGRWMDRSSASSARTLLENFGVYDARIVALN
jgi:rare lipoprotein A